MKPNRYLLDHDWPVTVEYDERMMVGRLMVKGLIGPLYKYVLMPSYAPDEKGVIRVVSWSFVDRERVLHPNLIKKLKEQEAKSGTNISK